MIDARLQAALDTHASAAPRAGVPALLDGSLWAEIAEAVRVPPTIGPDGALLVSPALRRAMDAVGPATIPEIPGPDHAPHGPYRRIGAGLTAPTDTPAVTGVSPWFTTGHWHWLAAQGYVRPLPFELGPTLPHLALSETQIIGDLQEWEALDRAGTLTEEAQAMFAAVTGDAELTVYGTVLLYAHRRREPVTLPAELREMGLQAAVRDIPRVSFVIGLTRTETVSALVNNDTVVFARQWRRGGLDDDAAAALRGLLDPQNQWKPYPLTSPITLTAEVTDALATGADTAGLFDGEPDGDASDEDRAAEDVRRARAREGARAVLTAAHIPAAAAEEIAAIATATTDALAQITVRVREAEVPRGEPAALAMAFLRHRGVIASYPSWAGPRRYTTYVTGNASGIATGIAALRRVATGRHATSSR